MTREAYGVTVYNSSTLAAYCVFDSWSEVGYLLGTHGDLATLTVQRSGR